MLLAKNRRAAVGINHLRHYRAPTLTSNTRSLNGFTSKRACPRLSAPARACPRLSAPVCACRACLRLSRLFAPVCACPGLFAPVCGPARHGETKPQTCPADHKKKRQPGTAAKTQGSIEEAWVTQERSEKQESTGTVRTEARQGARHAAAQIKLGDEPPDATARPPVALRQPGHTPAIASRRFRD